jgi:hypothetical protein
MHQFQFRNHSTHIATTDLFAVPSITFELLYVFIIVRLTRRDSAHVVMSHVASMPRYRCRQCGRVGRRRVAAPDDVHVGAQQDQIEAIDVAWRGVGYVHGGK